MNATGKTIAAGNVGPGVRRLNPHLFAGQPGVAEAKPKERRLRQDHKPKLNGLEKRFALVLASLYPGVVFHAQAWRVAIANGVWYKVDFCGVVDGRWVAYEVKGLKGKNIDRGKLAVKCAAAQFPEVDWRLVWFVDGQWKEQKVVP